MKKRYYSIFLSICILSLFASCSPTQYGAHFQPSKTPPSTNSSEEKVLTPEYATNDEAVEKAHTAVARRSGAVEVSTDLPSLNQIGTSETSIEETINQVDFAEKQKRILEETRERVKNMSRAEKRELRREIRKISFSDYTKDLPQYQNLETTEANQEPVNILALVFAILLPPLGVFLHQGEINNKFWISLVLSLLFFLPGVVYSVLVVLEVI